MKDECEKFASDLEKNRKVLEEAKLTAQVRQDWTRGRGVGGLGVVSTLTFP